MNLKAVSEGHAQVDAHMATAAAASARLGRPVTCRGAGCFGCCKEPVYAEGREAHAIVESLSPPEQMRVANRVRAWEVTFVTGGHGEASQQPPSGALSTDFKPLLRYRAANLWCPLLEGGACMAYSRRPSACRQHAAVGAPEKCHDDGRRPSQAYLTTDRQAEMNAAALLAMAGEEEEPRFEFDHLGVWLGRLLLGRVVRSAAACGFSVSKT